MITTVTLNAAIDKTYYLSSFFKNQTNRVETCYSVPGGKGINVAKVLNTLEIPVAASGFAGGFNGQFICRGLDQIGISHQFVQVDGESRLCLNLIDSRHHSSIEILEPGPIISPGEFQQLTLEVSKLAEKSEFVIFSGSLAQGLEASSYADLIHLVKVAGAKSVVDTSGMALRYSLESIPFMIKPNLQELSQLLGKKQVNEQDIVNFMLEWNKRGISIIVVSLGDEGALVCHHGSVFKVIPPAIEAVNPVGCGDSMVAGIIAALYRNMSVQEVYTFGTAVAVANALEERAGQIDVDKIETIRKEVQFYEYFSENTSM